MVVFMSHRCQRSVIVQFDVACYNVGLLGCCNQAIFFLRANSPGGSLGRLHVAPGSVQLMLV